MIDPSTTPKEGIMKLCSLQGASVIELKQIAQGHLFVIREPFELNPSDLLRLGLRVQDAVDQPKNSAMAVLFPRNTAPIYHKTLPASTPCLGLGRCMTTRVPDLLGSLTVDIDAGRPGRLAIHGAKTFLVAQRADTSTFNPDVWVDVATGEFSIPADPTTAGPTWFVTHWQMGMEDGRGTFDSLREFAPK